MSGTGTTEAIGITVAFGSLSLTLNMLDINMDGVSVSDINCSDQATTGGEKYVGSTLVEGGTYTINVNWNLTDQAALMAAVGTTDTITFTYPISTSGNLTAGSDSFSGYINSVSKSGSMKELFKGTITFKIAGTITTVTET
jgi:hypothetical protein